MRFQQNSPLKELAYAKPRVDVFSDALQLFRIDFISRAVDGFRTARSLLAEERREQNVTFGFGGFEVDSHTSSSFDDRMRFPTATEHGIGTPFISAMPFLMQDYKTVVLRQTYDAGPRGLFKISVPRTRIIVPCYAPPEFKLTKQYQQTAHEVLIIGDVALTDIELVEELPLRRIL